MAVKVNIIGAGVPGLAVGCYLQMNGFDTEIFEMHDRPGGVCTAWRRKGYTFDGCIHWLMGSGPGSSMGIDYWNGLRSTGPQRYGEEKQRVGELVVDALEAELGGVREFVEVVDVATPATWQRYTGNWKGSYEGFLPTRKTMMKNLGFTVPGLANFSMHGQWVAVGGGLPPAAMNGRVLAGMLCKKHGKRFHTVP